jgi:hypothetical protein
MGEQEKQVVRRWFEEVWNQRRDATIDEFAGEVRRDGVHDRA